MDFLNSLWGGIKSAGSGLLNMFGGGGNAKLYPGQSGYGQLSQQQLSQQNQFNGIGGLGSTQGGSKGFMSQIFNPQTLLGAGLTGIGLMKKPPKMPQSNAFQNYQSQVNQGGTPLNQQAQGVISGNLSKQFDPLTDPEIQAATRNTELQKNEAIKRLQGVYGSLRPGTDYTTDSNYKMDLANVERDFAQQGSDIVANRSRAAQDAFNTNQRGAVQQALGANEQQMNQLAQIAQLDIVQIMSQLNLDAQQAQSFKDTFLSLGTDLLYQGLGGSPMNNFTINAA